MIRELLREISKERFWEYIRGFSYGMNSTFIGAFKLKRWILHILAVVVSALIILSTLDWKYFLFFREHWYFQIILFTAVPIGTWLPFFFPPAIYLYAKKYNQHYLQPLALGLTRVGVAALFLSAFYKALTGRKHPDRMDELMGDVSRDFLFGFLRAGVFEGWPSGHVTINLACAIVFYCYRPTELTDQSRQVHPILKYQKYAPWYAIYMVICISTNIHWLSDAIAGIFFGFAVGLSGRDNLSVEIDRIPDYNTPEMKITFALVFLTIIFSIINLNFLFE